MCIRGRARGVSCAATMLLAGIGVVCAFGVFAQTYPTRPVKIVVPYPAGGGTDLRARLISEHLRKAFGQQFIIENKPGATGSIGAQQVARAKPDGYTLLCGFTTDLALNTVVFARLPYDPVKDFEPVAGVSRAPLILVVSTSFPVSSVEELIARAKTNPGTVSYASWGNGSLNHLAMALFSKLTGIEMAQVAYKGTGHALPDVVAGHVPLIFESPHNIEPHVRAGKLKPLLIAGPKRLARFPDTPAAPEVGLARLDVSGWAGILAPAGTPRPIIERLNAEINKALASPEIQARFVQTGGEVMPGTPEAFGTFLRSEGARLRRLVKEVGFTPES